MKRDATYDALSSVPAVRATLGALRSRIRAYVWLEALAAAGAWLAIVFWISLAIDWFFEPSAFTRGLILAAAAVATAVVFVRLIARCAALPLRDSNVATVLERRFPQFNDGLLTAVMLSGRQPEEAGFSPDMLAQSCTEAARRIEGVKLASVFNPFPLWRMLAAALLLGGAIAVFAAGQPGAMKIWAKRTLAFSDTLWPRNTQLTVKRHATSPAEVEAAHKEVQKAEEELETARRDGAAKRVQDAAARLEAAKAELVDFAGSPVKVARGADLEVFVRADIKRHVAPERVEVRYRAEDGAHHPTMTRLTGGRGSKKSYAEYFYTFHSLLGSMRFEVAGGDDVVHDLQIEVVNSPTLTEMTLDRRFPAYMELRGTPLPVTGVMQIPMGTRLTLHARANKELTEVKIDFAGEKKPREPVVLDAKHHRLSADHRGFTYALEQPLMQDTTLLFTLTDSDGIQNREPVPLAMVAIPDMPPQVALRLVGIGTAITPQARLPVSGTITDDYGIARWWFDCAVDRQTPKPAEETPLPRHPTELTLADRAMEVRPLNLKAGQTLLASVKAADLCDLIPKQKGNTGSSERWQLDVVTAEQLRAMLEAREAVLRWRFKAIVDEVTQTRDSLLRTSFGQIVGPGKAKKKPPAAAGATARQQMEDAFIAAEGPQRAEDVFVATEGSAAGSPPAHAEGAEPGEEAEPMENLSPEQQLNLQRSLVQLAIQSGRKNAQETLGVAEGFDDICRQLANNRVESEELRMRLGPGIAAPLHKIVERMFPELERRLDALETAVADPQRGPECRALALAAQQQADDLLLAMQTVLNQMVEMLDYNQVVERLRNLIKQQEQLRGQTDQLHHSQLREILEK